jgi:hypothetical protein
MRRIWLAAPAIALAASWAATEAAGDGGPVGIAQGWNGILAPGGKIRYVAVPAGPQTVIEAVRVRGGRVERWAAVHGSFGIPVVAYDGQTGGLARRGRLLVLSSWPGAPVSRFLVVGTKGFHVRERVTLRGVFSFDAVSPDGSTLYLIQYLDPRNYQEYRVRAYDLEAGRLLPGAIVDRREPGEKMTGQPVTRVTTRDARWVYTLYARSQGNSFVHALDTVRRQAFCLDVPLRVRQAVRLALSRDERRILLLQRRGGARLWSVAAPG